MRGALIIDCNPKVIALIFLLTFSHFVSKAEEYQNQHSFYAEFGGGGYEKAIPQIGKVIKLKPDYDEAILPVKKGLCF